MTADVGILSEFLQSFESAFKGGQVEVRGFAFNILGILVALELTFLGLWTALAGTEVVGPLLKKILVVGFFSWLVLNFDSITSEVLRGFTLVGRTAADPEAAKALGASSMLDPSSVVQKGFEITENLFGEVKEAGGWQLWVGWNAVLACISGIITVTAFWLVALQLFISRLEFTILVSLGLILVPFGVFKHTSFLAEKLIGGVLAHGIKLMVLTFIVAVAIPELTKYHVEDPKMWDQLINMAFAALTITYLCWHVPNLTAGLLSGGPSLSGLGVGGAALGVAAGSAAGAASLTVGGGLQGFYALRGGGSGGSETAAAVGGLGSSSSAENRSVAGSSGGAPAAASNGAAGASDKTGGATLTSAKDALGANGASSGAHETAGGSKGLSGTDTSSSAEQAQGSGDARGFAARARGRQHATGQNGEQSASGRGQGEASAKKEEGRPAGSASTAPRAGEKKDGDASNFSSKLPNTNSDVGTHGGQEPSVVEKALSSAQSAQRLTRRAFPGSGGGSATGMHVPLKIHE